MDLGPAIEVNVRGLFEIYDKRVDTFNSITFVDMVLNDPVLSTYLYIEESSTPFGLKKRLDVHYKSIYADLKQKTKKTSAPLIFTLAKKVVKDTHIIKGPDVGTPYLKITITQSASKQDASNFLGLFQYLLKYYFTYNNRPTKLYFVDYLPELKKLPTLKKSKKSPQKPKKLKEKKTRGRNCC